MKLILIYLHKNKIVLSKKNTPLVILAFLFTFKTSAQHITHDVGAFFGATSFLVDYEQGDGNFQNLGASVSVAHYMHFFNRSPWSNSDKLMNKIAIKTEFNYTSADLKNRGKYTNHKPATKGDKLKKMLGKSTIMQVGVHLEYYLTNLGDYLYPYNDRAGFNPYVTLGVRYGFYNKTIKSSYGQGYDSEIQGNNPPAGVLYPKYYTPNALATGDGSAFAFTMGFGTRYKISEKINLALQTNWQTFFADDIDGLQVIEPANKNNDWLLNFQIGIIYNLNYASPLTF